MTLLQNQTHHDEELNVTLVGLEIPWVQGVLPAGPHPGLVLCLTHMPDNPIHFPDLGGHFGFAGHTHGGGLRLPWIGPLLVPKFYGRFLDRGWFARQDSKLRITPGIGYFPARKSNNGELLRLKLVSSTDNS